MRGFTPKETKMRICAFTMSIKRALVGSRSTLQTSMPAASTAAPSSTNLRNSLARIRPRFTARVAVLGVAGIIIGLLGGYLAGKRIGFDEAAGQRRQMPNGSILCAPGPWGDIAYIPFTIAAPDDLLPVRTMEAEGTPWFFKGYTTDSLASLLKSTDLSPDIQQALLAPGVCQVQQKGILLSPPADLCISLTENARERLYRVLSQFVENESVLFFIRKETLDDRFSGSGVSLDTVALFKRLSCESGNYYVFSGLSAVLSHLQAPEDKLAFVKALTRQRTMLLRLHVTPKSNVEALTAYWGKGCWNTDVGTVLKSLTAIPTGTWMNILMVLPPIPTAELYDYPTIVDNPLEGPPVNRDSHWTALNFFRDDPDPNFGNPESVLKELKDNYAPAPADARYGDVVLFSRPDGSIVHSAVYIADNICFTKNGSTVVYPWMLSKISDLYEQYSFQLPPGQSLSVTYFRNKRL
jgi:hypothetical protein